MAALATDGEHPGATPCRPRSTVPRIDHSSLDRFGALAALGQARLLEWCAALAQALLTEGAQRRREWDQALRAADVLGWNGALTLPVLKLGEIAQVWGVWYVRQQLAVAQALLASFPLSPLGFAPVSGRRAGMDPGRRRAAVVIDFPDRRRPGPGSKS